MSRTSFELDTHNGVVRFLIGKPPDETGSDTQENKVAKRVTMSKKAKLNELRFYRLKAKKKINSPNPEVRIRYKLEKVGFFLMYNYSFLSSSISCFILSKLFSGETKGSMVD